MATHDADMTFGYGLVSGERHPDRSETAGELYRAAVDLARLAEQVGLDSIWTTEHHFVDSEYLPAPLTMATAMLATTSRIRVGTGVLLAPLAHPVRLAEEAATADLIGSGRLILGLGLGWSKVEFDAFGADRAKRGRALDEILDILHQAGDDDLVRHRGQVYDVPEVSIRPKATRGRVVVWIGGSSEAALRRAARHADGVLLRAPIEEYRNQVAILRAALDEAGRDPSTFEMGAYLTVLPREGGETAQQTWERYAELIQHAQWKYRDMGRSARRVGEPLPHREELDPETLAWVRACTLTGSPDQIADAIGAFRDAAGGRLHFVARNYLPGLSIAAQRELLEQFAAEIPPLLR